MVTKAQIRKEANELALRRHKSNLYYGGVFTENPSKARKEGYTIGVGNRISNLKLEKRVALRDIKRSYGEEN
jgi:hypothetical protein